MAALCLQVPVTICAAPSHPSQATFTRHHQQQQHSPPPTNKPTQSHKAMANATATKKDDSGTPSRPPNGAGGASAPNPATAPPLARQPAPSSWLRTQFVNAFNTYVPPHVRRRPRSLPTFAELRVLFSKYIHLPAIPIRHWLPRYTVADASADAIGGITIGVMCIPQGMRQEGRDDERNKCG